MVVNLISQHPAYLYASGVLNGTIKAPRYVILQCSQFKHIADGRCEKYFIDEEKVQLIGNLLKLLIMPKGLKARQPIYNCVAGFQWLFFIAILCTAYRDNPERRRYETVILEICRKNGKTFIIAVIFILLFFLEPKFSKFYSVAPDGSLSREVKTAITEIIGSSPALEGKFKIRRDDILCQLTQSDYIPLNYSTSRLDGKLPNVFLVDEAGALPVAYAIEAMRSGQLTILNKLGCIISTKYPKYNNPFEDEVAHAKRVLDGISDDETCFALLYEPDDTVNWSTNDEILEQANPLALEVPEIMDDLKKKRALAIETESKRENFITKHCNIIYQGAGTESYIPVADVQKCKVERIDWAGKEVYLGIDLALTTDNCAVSMVSEDDGDILAESLAFIPEDRIEEKSKLEKVDYNEFIRTGKCFACGDRTVDYKFIEDTIMGIEKKYGVKVIQAGFDRMNCLSTAQKLENAGFDMVEIKQHSSVLHAPTKLLEEMILGGKFRYEENKMLEINFENARCTFDTNLNRYVNKKKSAGKVDMVVSLINAVYLLQQNVFLGDSGFGVQVC